MLLMPCIAALRNNGARESERPLEVQPELATPQPFSNKLDSGSVPAPHRPRPMTSFEARLEEDFASDPNVRRPGKFRPSTERSGGSLLDDPRAVLASAQVYVREHSHVASAAVALPPIVADLPGQGSPDRTSRNRLECAEIDALRAHAVAMRAQAEDFAATARVAVAKAQLALDEAALVERTAARAILSVNQAA